MDADDWDQKMKWLRKMQQLYSTSGRGPGGGPVAPPSNPLQDENYIPITTENSEEITV